MGSSTKRFPRLTANQLTPEQTRLAQSLLAGPRGEGDASPEAINRLLARGPFNAWMRSPELGERLQKAGEYIRFKSSLPKRLNEFAILITARHWTSQFEWWAHLPMATPGRPRSAARRRPRAQPAAETHAGR